MENTTMFGGSLWIWVIFIGFTVISWLISHQLKSRFQKYSKIPTANGMTCALNSVPVLWKGC